MPRRHSLGDRIGRAESQARQPVLRGGFQRLSRADSSTSQPAEAVGGVRVGPGRDRWPRLKGYRNCVLEVLPRRKHTAICGHRAYRERQGRELSAGPRHLASQDSKCGGTQVHHGRARRVRKTFADTLLEVGQEDPDLVVLVGDISHFALQPFAQACPGRFYNVGILEPTIVNMAAGLAITGFCPVVHTIAPFLVERSFEQIKLDFCYQELGGTLISVGGAFDYAGLGCSHHCYDDLALIKGLPNTEVIYPAGPNEFRSLFRQTYRDGKLTYFRLPAEKHSVDIPDSEIAFGKGIRVRRGRDVTVLAAGPQLKTAVAALPALAGCGIEAEVLYYPTIKPFDEDLVRESVGRTKRLVVIEEHVRYGGLGDEALRATCTLNARYAFINIPDRFQRGYGDYADHCNALGFTPENLVAQCLTLAGQQTGAVIAAK